LCDVQACSKTLRIQPTLQEPVTKRKEMREGWTNLSSVAQRRHSLARHVSAGIAKIEQPSPL